MSRAASMQVLNDAFRNLNAAFGTYMQNKNFSRRTDLMDEFGRLDRQYRAQQAAQAQANADRNFNAGREDRAQAQSNWQQNFDANRENANRAYGLNSDKFDWQKQQAAQAQRNWQQNFDNQQAQQQQANWLGMAKAVDASPNPETAYAVAQALNYAGGDPIVANAFVSELFKEKKKRELNAQQAALNKQMLDMWKAKTIKPSDIQNLVEGSTMSADEGKAYLRNNYNGFPMQNRNAPMTAEQALQAYRDGKITKEQLAEIRKGL